MVKRQIRKDKNYDIAGNYDLFLIGSTVVVQQEEGGPGTHGTIVCIGNHNLNNRSYTISITVTGYIVTRNSKHIKTTPITAEQYLKDHLTQHTNDLVERMLKQYETLSMDKVQSNNKSKRRGETHMKRTHIVKHSDIQIRDTQGHAMNIVPNNGLQTVSDQGNQRDQSVTVSDKQDDNINM